MIIYCFGMLFIILCVYQIRCVLLPGTSISYNKTIIGKGGFLMGRTRKKSNPLEDIVDLIIVLVVLEFFCCCVFDRKHRLC